MSSYYDILGVNPSASKAEIKSAFKAKALVYHPDRNFGDESKAEIFKKLNEAHRTLTNDYSRSQYDMLLRYRESGTQSGTYAGYRDEHRPRPSYVKKDVPITSKENLRATGYAFLFAFCIAGLIKIGLLFYQEHQARKHEELLDTRRQVFQSAEQEKELGRLTESLKIISSLGYFYVEEEYMSDFKYRLLKTIRAKGDSSLEVKDYQMALKMYGVLKEYPLSSSSDHLRNVAFAYKGLGDIKKAIDIYRVLHLNGYQSMDFYFEMGLLYEEGVSDYKQALKYYQIGAKKAAGSYEVSIGKAYPILINAGLVPAKHYDIYMKVAQMHFLNQQYREAIQSVAWTKEIWPDSLFQYAIEAKSYQELGDTNKMKEVRALAMNIDPDFQLSLHNFEIDP